MKPRNLFNFWVVTKEGGFARAAERLDMAIQTITRPSRPILWASLSRSGRSQARKRIPFSIRGTSDRRRNGERAGRRSVDLYNLGSMRYSHAL